MPRIGELVRSLWCGSLQSPPEFGVVARYGGPHSGTMRDLDLGQLACRATAVARRTDRDATVEGLRRLDGGVSSLTYAATLTDERGAQPIVLKVAPPGLAPVRNRDVLRQARVLDLLASLPGFPVPAVLFRDGGAPPAIPPLFAMQLRRGDSYEPALDVCDAPPGPAVAAERMRVAARALARLQAASPRALGLGDEPSVSAGDELERWRRLFYTVDADIGVGHEKLHARLARHVPQSTAARLLHGDFRLANMLFVGSDLEAVIDWEIWSVGDPRCDLAWLLMHADPAHVFYERRSAADLAAGSALPSRAALIEEYVAVRMNHGSAAAEVKAATVGLSWFLGICFYKTASTIAVIYKRDRKRLDPDPKLHVAAGHLDAVLEAGHRALDGLT